MELKDIITLCTAGFSKDEILAFAQPAQPAQPAPVAQPAQPAPVAQPTPVAQPAQPAPVAQPAQPAPVAQPGQPAPVAQPAQVEQTTLLDAINGLAAQIKTMNITQTEQPKAQTAEDVLASIIMPRTVS